MRNVVNFVLFVLIGLACCSKFAIAQGPTVEFVNQNTHDVTIAIAGWTDNRSTEPSQRRGEAATSSLAVMPGPPFEWVRGWYTFKAGETGRLDRGYGGFYYTMNKWENRTDIQKPQYFWVHRSISFRTERKRQQNEIQLNVTFDNQTLTAFDLAPLPDSVSWHKEANGSYKNRIQSVGSEVQISDDGFVPFPFIEIQSGTKRVIFANGKISYQK